ncbi:hypothetical protein P7C70_g6202, partial [Phenoliferia sp. Uapishka_3]
MASQNASLATLPTELKQLIARMAREQDEYYKHPGLEPWTDDREIAIRSELGGLYGRSLRSLSEANRDWHAVTASYKFENFCIGQLIDMKKYDRPFFLRVKHRVRGVKIAVGGDGDEEVLAESDDPDNFLSILGELPNLQSLDVTEWASVPSVIELFENARQSGWTKRIKSFTLVAPSNNSEELAQVLTSLSSLVELHLIDPVEMFDRYNGELRDALAGLNSLRKLSIKHDPTKGTLYFDENWAKEWKPALEELVVAPVTFSNALASFVAGQASTLRKLSLQHWSGGDEEQDQKERLTLFQGASFPLLTDLRLRDYGLLRMFSASPLVSLHLDLDGEMLYYSFLEELLTLDLLEAHISKLNTLRLDVNSSDAYVDVDKDLQDLCARHTIDLDVRCRSSVRCRNYWDPSAKLLSAASQELLEKALKESKRIQAGDDKQRAQALEQALNGVRVLLELQRE